MSSPPRSSRRCSSRPGWATRHLPSSALAAVVIVAALSLADPAGIARLRRVRPTEFALSLLAFVGVAAFGVLWGIGVAVGLSLMEFVSHAWRPYMAELGRVDHRKGYHDLDRHPEGWRIPGLVIARFDAPLFFANAAVSRPSSAVSWRPRRNASAGSSWPPNHHRRRRHRRRGAGGPRRGTRPPQDPAGVRGAQRARQGPAERLWPGRPLPPGSGSIPPSGRRYRVTSPPPRRHGSTGPTANS